jgi:hypothetical protein
MKKKIKMIHTLMEHLDNHPDLVPYCHYKIHSDFSGEFFYYKKKKDGHKDCSFPFGDITDLLTELVALYNNKS